MELHCSQTCGRFGLPADCLRPLWNYTALKHTNEAPSLSFCLRPLWNYTALKLVQGFKRCLRQFETPMELHCSQTCLFLLPSIFSLRPLWNYTALKQLYNKQKESKRLRPLWNYTALKLISRKRANLTSLRPLWNYTALKRKFVEIVEYDSLRPLWNYTALKQGQDVPMNQNV